MKTTKRVLGILLVLALGLAMFAPAAQGLFFITNNRIINPGIPGLLSPSINWFALLQRIFSFFFDSLLRLFTTSFWLFSIF